jgi:hypothetical protein
MITAVFHVTMRVEQDYFRHSDVTEQHFERDHISGFQGIHRNTLSFEKKAWAGSLHRWAAPEGRQSSRKSHHCAGVAPAFAFRAQAPSRRKAAYETNDPAPGETWRKPRAPEVRGFIPVRVQKRDIGDKLPRDKEE